MKSSVDANYYWNVIIRYEIILFSDMLRAIFRTP